MTVATATRNYELRFVRTKAMIPSGENPRRTFDTEKAEELEKSVKRRGIIQTVSLVPLPPEERAKAFDAARQRLPEKLFHLLPAPENITHAVVAGERRWRAALASDIAELPSLVYSNISRPLLLEIMLTENTHRETLSTWDLALFLQRTFEEMRTKNPEAKQQDLADRFDVSQTQISQSLAILNAPYDVRRLVESEKIALAPGVTLAKISSKDMRRHFAQMLMDADLPQTEWLTVVRKYISVYELGKPEKRDNGGSTSEGKRIFVPVNVTRTDSNGRTVRITGSTQLSTTPPQKGLQCLCHLCPIHGKRKEKH